MLTPQVFLLPFICTEKSADMPDLFGTLLYWYTKAPTCKKYIFSFLIDIQNCNGHSYFLVCTQSATCILKMFLPLIGIYKTNHKFYILKFALEPCKHPNRIPVIGIATVLSDKNICFLYCDCKKILFLWAFVGICCVGGKGNRPRVGRGDNCRLLDPCRCRHPNYHRQHLLHHHHHHRQHLNCAVIL